MGHPVTGKKPLEDLLAEYTDDLLAERRPRLPEDLAGLGEDEQAQLMEMLAVVRRLKAAHREIPPPREAFLHHLDAFVRDEIAPQLGPESQAAQSPPGSPQEARPASTTVPFPRRVLQTAGEFLRGIVAAGVGGRWRFVGVAALVLVLGLQIQLYFQVRRLERQNQALVARLERVGPLGGVTPLALPRDRQPTQDTKATTPSPSSLDDLLTNVELRARIEHRLRELEMEAQSKTGGDRQIAEAVLRELRALLQPPRRP